MSKVAEFRLTEEGFKSHEALLAAQGVKVQPTEREIIEDLVKGGSSHICTYGNLNFENYLFSYSLRSEDNGYFLTVRDFPQEKGKGKELVAAIDRAFPTPDAQWPRIRFDRQGIGATIGCLGVLVFILAVIFFAVVGFWKSFYK
jgi:hypothetical protein